MTRKTFSVVLVFLWMRVKQCLSAQTDDPWLPNKTSLASNHTFKTVHIPFPLFRMEFPGEGESYLYIAKGPPQPGKRTMRDGTLSVPEGKFISLKTNSFQTTASSCKDIQTVITLSVPFNHEYKWGKHVYPCDDPVLYLSSTNKANIFVRSYLRGPQHSVLINITALDQSGRNFLNVTYHSNFSGTIVPYGFDGLSDYAPHMVARASVSPPTGHSVMLSFPHFHVRPSMGCFIDTLILRKYRGKYQNYQYDNINHCGTLQLLPTVFYNLAGLDVSFHTNTETGYSGFKIRFSFHNTSESPKKHLINDTSSVAFNCSVPFYPKFSQHLNCNLETECVQGEDEASCPYSGGTCEPDFLNSGSDCYKYIKTRKTMTWFDASAACLLQGLTLASFPTLKQMSAFRENILRFAPTPFEVLIGLQTSDSSLPAMYKDVWQWSGGTMAYYIHIDEQVFKPACISFAILSRDVSPIRCNLLEYVHYIFCQTDKPSVLKKSSSVSLSLLGLNSTFRLKKIMSFVTCPDGHMTRDFISCNHASQCGRGIGVKSCITSDSAKRSLEIPMYVCDSQTQTIHYTQVCDHRAQCFDSSDETFCIHQECIEKTCLNKQCVTVAQWCDGMAHCTDGSDEECPQFVTGSGEPSSSSTSGYHVVLFDGHGKYKYIPQGDDFPVCPQTHFLCADRKLCIPVYLRCNGVYDCTDQVDEDNCGDVTCPGYYRCRGSRVCVHLDHVCDGVFQCPQQDDELLCHLTCPDNCRCQGLAFVCPRHFPVQNYSHLRYLDSSHSGLDPNHLFQNHYLIRLSLSSCELYTLPLFHFCNLKFLDLSHNILTNVSMQIFSELSNLKHLILSRNPINSLFAAESIFLLKTVHSLDLSHTKLRYFGSGLLANVRNLKKLNLSHCILRVIDKSGFQNLTQIESLDLRGTKLKVYPVKMLQSLSSLRVIFSDVYKLCCQDVLPGHFSTQNCHTIPDEIASCEDLLRSDIFRMFLWITCSIALIGNSLSLFSRCYVQRRKQQSSFNVFITHLNISDFFMGLYLAMIGSADQVYRGTYLWHDVGWKTSTACKTAGFFSLLSCEMSAFIISFITLDRFLVMRFPFSHMRFGNTSAQLVCGFSWVISVALAILPLLPVTEHWEFYSQTDICIPLPVTRHNFKGQFYSFGILIVFNFLLFILIATGQFFIYISIRDNSMSTDQKNTREATVARRLLTVVTSDFLCWFPIGLLGLLASNGVPIPGDVNVAMAIFALPLNSALNPFLYTFNLLMEKRQRASEERLLRRLQTKYRDQGRNDMEVSALRGVRQS